MLDPNDPMLGFVDRLLKEGNQRKIDRLIGGIICIRLCLGLDKEVTIETLIESGIGCRESIEKLFAEIDNTLTNQ